MKPAVLLALGALIVTTGLVQAGPSFKVKKFDLARSFESAGLFLSPNRDPRADTNGMDDSGKPPVEKVANDWGVQHDDQTWSEESDSVKYPPQPIDGGWKVETATAPGIPAPVGGPVSSHGLTLAP